MIDDIKVYLICGKARSGKDTIGDMLKSKLEERNHKVCNIQIMRTLKGYLKDYFNWDGTEENKPRTLLQTMGTELIREKLNMPNFHLDRLTEDIKVLSNYFDIFIVDDIRLINEIEEIKKRFSNVTSIGVEKENYISPLTETQEKHITEHDLDNYNDYDYKIINRTREELDEEINKIIDLEVK